MLFAIGIIALCAGALPGWLGRAPSGSAGGPAIADEPAPAARAPTAQGAGCHSSSRADDGELVFEAAALFITGACVACGLYICASCLRCRRCERGRRVAPGAEPEAEPDAAPSAAFRVAFPTLPPGDEDDAPHAPAGRETGRDLATRPTREADRRSELSPRGFAAGACCVCQAAGAAAVNVPCGHVCLCADCARRAPARCPICRVPTAACLKLFAA